MNTRSFACCAACFSLVLLFSGCATRERVAQEFDIASKRLDTSWSEGLGDITTTHRDYDFMQAAGGIRVNAPTLQPDGTYFLPVMADVSGASNITRTPTQYHAKIAIREVVFSHDKKDDKRLYVAIKTGWPNETAPSPVTRGRNIGKLTPGQYTLEYLNSDGTTVLLGGFTVKE